MRWFILRLVHCQLAPFNFQSLSGAGPFVALACMFGKNLRWQPLHDFCPLCCKKLNFRVHSALVLEMALFWEAFVKLAGGSL